MFAGYWSIVPVWLAKTFGRRAFVIVGGTDCVSFPEFNYGSLRKPIIRKAIRYSLTNCTAILPVAKELVAYDYTYFEAEEKKQGYLNFFPEIKTPFTVVYNGYDVVKTTTPSVRQPNSFITIAKIDSATTYNLKGIPMLIELAKVFPSFQFTIVGINSLLSKQFALEKIRNLTCIPFTDSSGLVDLLQRNRFYMCISLSEGFPNALCEGMSFGCVPIGSNVSSIPFIIGDTGFVVNRKDQLELNELVKKASLLSASELESMGINAQKRIADNFSLSKRETAFRQIIEL